MTTTYPQPTPRPHTTSRRAQLTHCPCGMPTLTGLDNDRCAFPANADLSFLTWPGEIAAIHLDGRVTYALLAGTLFRRDEPTRSTESTHPIVAEHRCGDPIPDTWRKPTPPTRRREDTNEPPF